VAQSSKAAKRERQRQNRAVKLEQQAAVEKRQRFWRSTRGFIIILVPIAVLFAFFALRGGGDDSSSSSNSDKSSQSKGSEATTTITTLPAKAALPKPEMTIDPAKTYSATIETTEGTIELALDAANAPTSVNNFVYLGKAGFYDGLLITRASKNFVIQTGSPDNTQSGGPGYTIQSEAPPAAYELGSVAWAKTGSEAAGTAGSQFFIGTGTNITTLPKDYGYIGKVTKGLDVAQKIMGFAPASGDGPPSPQVQMTKVTISES
jgi:peptidyl-prolyl cis-trans isomerase B (cyclophilin B)